MSRPTPKPPAECAQCGAAIPPTARACRECGADERTGWRDASIYDGLDLPDDAFEDDDGDPAGSAGRRPATRPPGSGGLSWYWLIALVAVLIALLISTLGLR